MLRRSRAASSLRAIRPRPRFRGRDWAAGSGLPCRASALCFFASRRVASLNHSSERFAGFLARLATTRLESPSRSRSQPSFTNAARRVTRIGIGHDAGAEEQRLRRGHRRRARESRCGGRGESFASKPAWCVASSSWPSPCSVQSAWIAATPASFAATIFFSDVSGVGLSCPRRANAARSAARIDCRSPSALHERRRRSRL